MDSYNEKRPLMSDMDDDVFGAKSGSIVSAFDAFPKSKPQYVTQTAGGGKWTVVMMIISLLFTFSETARWWRGSETHTFAVEKGVGHELQINLDVVVHMKCDDLHVNVQDSAGDWIHAGEALRKDPTLWSQWVNEKGVHKLGHDQHGRVVTGHGYEADDEGFGEEHVHDIVRQARKTAKWAKTPRLRGSPGDSCRIYGSMLLNKVQGDFHITARGHGYQSGGEHVDHNAFDFSHVISELSFGPFHPSLVNPLDRTINTCVDHFYKFQYFLSIVPTEYRVGNSRSRAIATNQYAVTEQSRAVNEMFAIPGIFVKYDIEPLLLKVVENRAGLLAFMVKIINVVSGVLVAGHWGYRLSDWLREVLGKRRRSGVGYGMLGHKHMED
ncbi:hypothetical protein TD95_000143 [Thielaviopsis punctulata]|uniref:Endoplasmic reticulum-Golgi intermediate compartment protein n=1 Tax=Thielaviopsis punctulata TaxID=72032 RepID=A0A0F4Z9A3_9PEZI|nr:hypothetical protein TD95_000143 [Thielaviopsis punctulata]